ncbi:hypothetical protein [Leptospira interrogans]|uniref:hypothetical protein n=1 Tax=Leptospira interrogans TaxID=173 RepID=UPI00031B879C|nr:hypothetical protein [Leptospira interrogans]QYY62572.1 hypothetical protein GR153_019510 [Leptospira interrogans serovar Bataviae]
MEIVSLLVERGASVEHPLARPHRFYTLNGNLFLAICYDQPAVLDFFLKKGFEVYSV